LKDKCAVNLTNARDALHEFVSGMLLARCIDTRDNSLGDAGDALMWLALVAVLTFDKIFICCQIVTF
jgi:hypothetical protein